MPEDVGSDEPQTSTPADQHEDPQLRTILPDDIEWMPYRITVLRLINIR